MTTRTTNNTQNERCLDDKHLIERFVINFLPDIERISLIISRTIKKNDWHEDIKQEILLYFIENVKQFDTGEAFQIGWRYVTEHHKRYEIPFSRILKNFNKDGNFSESEKITGVGKPAPTKHRGRRNYFFNHSKARKCWELRASGMAKREIAKQVGLALRTVEKYMYLSKSVPIVNNDTKIKAMDGKRFRIKNREKAILIRNALKNSKSEETIGDIANAFGVSKSLVSRINSGKRWGWLEENCEYPLKQIPPPTIKVEQ